MLIKKGEYVNQAIKENPILTEVQGLLEKQTLKGIEKYPNTVRPSDFGTIGWIEHAQEEIIDMLVYLTILKVKLKGMGVNDK